MSRFRRQSVEITQSQKTQFGTGLDLSRAAVIIPCVQGLRGKASTMIFDETELEELGLNDDILVEFGTATASNKLLVPNCVKAFVQSFFAQKPRSGLLLVRGCPKGGGFVTVNPAGKVDHDVYIKIDGLDFKVTTKGTDTIKDENGVGGALVTASGTAEGVKDALTFSTVNGDGLKHTSIVDKNGSEKYNWFLNTEKSKNIKPYNWLATLDPEKIDKVLDNAELSSEPFYLFSVISAYAPPKECKTATFWKPYEGVMKWVELRDGDTKPPKVYIQDVPQELVAESTWNTEADAKVASGLYTRTSWVSNPDYKYDNAAAKIVSRHASIEHPGQKPFLRIPVVMSHTYTPSQNKIHDYEKARGQFLGYFGVIDRGSGLNGGRTMAGEQLQHLIADDAIKEALTATLMSVIYNKDHPLQFTETDISILKATLERVLREKQSYGVIAPDESSDPGFSVSVPKNRDIPMADKSKGHLKNVRVMAKLSGGIEKIFITFNSTLR